VSFPQITLETMKDLDIIISNAGWTAFGEFNDLGKSTHVVLEVLLRYLE
jgi:hypothetical protein